MFHMGVVYTYIHLHPFLTAVINDTVSTFIVSLPQVRRDAPRAEPRHGERV